MDNSEIIGTGEVDKYDEYGNCIIDLEISDEEVAKFFRAYMISNSFSFSSECHFEDYLKRGTDINECMGRAVFNEFVFKAVSEQVERLKTKIKDELKEAKKHHNIRYC